MRSAPARYRTSPSGSPDPPESSDKPAACPPSAIYPAPSSAPQSRRRPSSFHPPVAPPRPASSPPARTADIVPASPPAHWQSSHSFHTGTARSRPSPSPSCELYLLSSIFYPLSSILFLTLPAASPARPAQFFPTDAPHDFPRSTSRHIHRDKTSPALC